MEYEIAYKKGDQKRFFFVNFKQKHFQFRIAKTKHRPYKTKLHSIFNKYIFIQVTFK